MAFRVCSIIGGVLFLIFTCQSAPINSNNPIHIASSITDPKQSVHEDILTNIENDQSSSISTTTSTLATERNDVKQKREINADQSDLDGIFNDDKSKNFYPYRTLNRNGDDDDDDDDDNENEHILYTDVKETPAKYDEMLDRLDDKNLFSDLQMNPTELATILHRRRRRDVKLMDPLNQRRKRSLSSYDRYSSESFDDPWANFVDEQRYVRPLRSFAPIYWYPPVLERSVRSFNRNFRPIEYVNPLVNDADVLINEDDDGDEDDDDEIPMTIYQQDDDDDDYEPNRYPILMKSYSNPFDNLQLQTTYNNVEVPFDDDDENSLAIIAENDDDNDNFDDEEFPILFEQERPSFMRYDPIENFIEV